MATKQNSVDVQHCLEIIKGLDRREQACMAIAMLADGFNLTDPGTKKLHLNYSPLIFQASDERMTELMEDDFYSMTNDQRRWLLEQIVQMLNW